MMDAHENMRQAIKYIEENLDGEINYPQIARIALCSQYHFQRMFVFLTGIPLAEYIRRRRLTLAVKDLQNTDGKVMDIAVKYGYSSADAFSRAFHSMHNVTPSQARKKGVMLKVQPPVTFTLSLKGVSEMNYHIEEKDAFSIIGIKKNLSFLDDLGKGVGEMWADTSHDTIAKLSALANVEPLGLIGAYSEMYENSTTDYHIGVITTKECPDEFYQLDVPGQTWAVFDIVGPLPDAMRDVWGRIYSEFFPATGYEEAKSPDIEWYSYGDMSSETYRSEIWIPIIIK